VSQIDGIILRPSQLSLVLLGLFTHIGRAIVFLHHRSYSVLRNEISQVHQMLRVYEYLSRQAIELLNEHSPIVNFITIG
jgi:hypothetical protein